jgi:hypothetical protein
MIKQRVTQLSLIRMKKISGKTRRCKDGRIFSVKLRFHLDRKGNNHFEMLLSELNVNKSMIFLNFFIKFTVQVYSVVTSFFFKVDFEFKKQNIFKVIFFYSVTYFFFNLNVLIKLNKQNNCIYSYSTF